MDVTDGIPPLRIDADAVLWSASEAERAGRPLLVLLHGYGSHEGDLFGLAPSLPLRPVVASVRAPIPEAGGHAWFSRGTRGPGDADARAADAAARAVLDWLGTLPPAPSTGLLGFSQGAATALQVLRLEPEAVDCTVFLSGYVARGEHPGDAELARRRPPVFWGRGTEDDVIPAAALERTAAWLPAHASADIRVYEGLAHGVSAQELADVSAFLAARLA